MVAIYLVAIDLLNFMGAKIAKHYGHQLNVVYNSYSGLQHIAALWPSFIDKLMLADRLPDNTCPAMFGE